jgi:hypothetical protein
VLPVTPPTDVKLYCHVDVCEIQISTDVLDSYFDPVSFIGRMTTQEWIESGEKISESMKNEVEIVSQALT